MHERSRRHVRRDKQQAGDDRTMAGDCRRTIDPPGQRRRAGRRRHYRRFPEAQPLPRSSGSEQTGSGTMSTAEWGMGWSSGSLGEAYETRREAVDAIDAYPRSLRLDKTHDHAKTHLKILGDTPST
jgi:hypothetical protein